MQLNNTYLGISLSPAGSSDGRGRVRNDTRLVGRPVSQTFETPSIRSRGDQDTTPQKKVQVELSEEHYEKLKSIGML